MAQSNNVPACGKDARPREHRLLRTLQKSLRRVEIAVPILDNKIKAQIIREGLRVQWQHPGNAWDMDSEGHYHRPRGSRSRLSCHQVLMNSRMNHNNS